MSVKSIVQTSSRGTKGRDFYLELDFSEFQFNEKSYVTDGKVIIELNPDLFSRPGIKLYGTDWIKILGSKKHIDSKNEIIIQDPNGVRVHLAEGEMGIDPSGIDIRDPVPGNFAGISIECLFLDESLEFWQELGFSIESGSADQGWISLKNRDNFGLSLMKPLVCPHRFINPSLTYFNSGKNLEIIAKIRDKEITILEEIDHFNQEGIIDNIILQDPGGMGMFIFND